LGILFIALGLACQLSAPAAAPAPSGLPPSATATITLPTATLPPASPTFTPSATTRPSETPQPTATATFTATPGPYWSYTIDHLAQRDYGPGALEIVELIGDGSLFTRYLVRYPSDGLWIYGFMNVPHLDGPLPVIIAIHGYINPSIYQTLDYTTGYADAFARAGYLVIHPNLRGYAPSDDGDNLFRVGMAIDILNLIQILDDQAGRDSLEKADPDRLGLWGHSMGGGISTRVLTVTDRVKAAVLYGAMSGDEVKNFEAIQVWSGASRGLDELTVPADSMRQISPMYFFDRVTAQVSIHHGEQDTLVPPAWSQTTCEQMEAAQVNVTCTFYPGMPHTFFGDGNQLFVDRTIEFFNQVLGPAGAN
jgi:dienelactone hydrolase